MKYYCTSDNCPLNNNSLCCVSCNHMEGCIVLCDTANAIKRKEISTCVCCPQLKGK